jgi:hypothetical protein
MPDLRNLVGNLVFSQRTFEFLQKRRVHLVRKQLYGPIPDTALLARKEGLWEKESELAGVDMNLEGQLEFLRNVVASYAAECDYPKQKTDVPYEYFVQNNYFGLSSAMVLHSTIRHFKPRTIIEVGSGNSTYVSARACRLNREQGHETELIAIEPYPNPTIKKGFPGLSRLVTKRVEDVGLELFGRLGENDILFIDTSHVVKIGADVNFLFLEVLPRLNKGVIVHVDDIFFPFHYPKEWVINERRFWTEQYLLQAFLIFNNTFQVTWCDTYVRHKAYDDLEKVIPGTPRFDEDSSSFWMRKVL